MEYQSESSLNQTFGIDGHLKFETREGLSYAHLVSAAGEAELCLQGAHVFSWRCNEQKEPVLWLSRDAQFRQGKAIRGGVPVCWPWFGPYAGPTPDAGAASPALPAHGFARVARWEVRGSRLDIAGMVWLTLALPQAAMPSEMWPHNTSLELVIGLGDTLQFRLTTRNLGQTPCVLGEALHTYFNISDIGAVSVGGLDGCTYWDTVGEVTKRVQQGDIRFVAETDRVYINSAQPCVIDDPGFARRIYIRKRGSLSTVVWNPWTAKAERMGDLGQPDGWRQMLCVESANAWDNRITLGPDEASILSVEYAVEAL